MRCVNRLFVSLIFVMVIWLILFVSPALAQDWIKQESGATAHDLHDVDVVNQLLVFAAGSSFDPLPFPGDGLIVRTQDAGENWETVWDGDVPIYGICSLNANDIIAVGAVPFRGDGPMILRTENSGNSWDPVESPADTGTLWDVFCINDGLTAYAVGGVAPVSGESGPFADMEALILKTTNGGATWTHLSSGVERRLNGVYFVDATHGYAVGDGGNVLKTTDGVNFENLGPFANDRGVGYGFNNIFCVDMETCWAVKTALGEVVHKTIDGGESWTLQDSGLDMWNMEGVHFIDENLGWVTGQNQIRHTEDGGDNWEVDSTDISNDPHHIIPAGSINDVQFVSPPGMPNWLVGWAVGNDYWDRDIGETPETGRGVIFRYGEPFSCPPISPDLDEIECEWPNFPVPVWDEETNCHGGYECMEGTSIPEGEETDEEDEAQMARLFESEVDEDGEEDSFSKFMKNDRANFYVIQKNGIAKVIGVELRNGKVGKIGGKIEDSTLSVYLSQETLDRITSSDSPASEAFNAYKNKRITVKGETFGAKIKLFFARLFFK